MRLLICLTVVFAVALVVVRGEVEEQQKRILRRVIKSTPTATNLGRVRLVTVRSTAAGTSEKGAVAEISSKEAANFGQRSANETTSQASKSPKQPGAPAPTTQTPATSTTQNVSPSTTVSPSTAAAPTTQASATTTTSTTSNEVSSTRPLASDRQQSGPSSPEVELLAGAPSSWQTMTAVEAPAAMLIATGARAAASDLASSSSSLHSSSEESATGDFLRSSATKGSASYTQDYTLGQQDQTFSRIQQQQQQQQQARQSFFYPQPARSKTSGVKGTKTNWYQPPATTSTTPRPAPLIQEHYEQQSEQYVEQTPQLEYGAAPLGQAEPFAFDFKTLDNNGNGQYRKEESDKDGVVRGSYGYTDANGIYRHVEYVADHNGFRADIKSNEPGLNGETQPASIRLNGGQAAPANTNNNQRLTAPSSDNGDWISSNNLGSQSADLVAIAPPNFESGHRSDRIRSPRQYRN